MRKLLQQKNECKMQLKKKPLFTIFGLLLTLSLFLSHTVQAQSYYPGGLPKSVFNLWFDASDASTITQSGGLVTQWKDKINLVYAAQATTTKQPVVTTLFGTKAIEFNGAKGLDIVNGTYLNPPGGFNLMQMVYVYTDAPTALIDTRYGTYTRNVAPNSLNIGTPNTQLRYVLNANTDSAYRFALIGSGNHAFNDLRGNFGLIENYMTASTGTSTNELNGGFTSTGTVSTPQTFTNPATIGNRQQFYSNVHWAVNETLLTGVPIGNSGRQILECYMAWKWRFNQNLNSSVLALYNPSDTSFRNKLVGIGSAGGTDTVLTVQNNNGLAFANTNAVSGFARENGDFLMAADNNAAATTQSAGTGFTRWNRSWYFSKTDVGNNGGGLKIILDFGVYGGTLPNLSTTDVYLLYNQTKGDFSTGSNYVIPVSSVLAANSKIIFTTDAANIGNGFYTIVYAPHGTPTTQITNYAVFVPVVIALRTPVLTSIYSGNTYATLNWNIDSLGFTPSAIKIYRGTSANTLNQIDSVTNNNVSIYNNFSLSNSTTYYYALKAADASGKVSGYSNIVSVKPGFHPAVWNIQPQFAGNNTAIMASTIPTLSSTLMYYFEYTTSGVTSNSGWISMASYKDSTLSSGSPTTFHVKTAESSNLTGTSSDWSPTISVSSTVDSLQGGFTYNFAQFNHSDNNVYGLGPTNVTLNTAGTPYIKLAPAPGIHPRLFCSPQDSTAIKGRLKNTASGRAIAKKIHAFTTLLTLGSGYNQTASYAVDSLNIPYVGGLYSKYNVKSTYDMLAAKTTPATSALNDYLSIAMAYEAFECWLFKGTKDATTNTYYNDRAAKLAKAETYWASLVLADTTKSLGQGISLLYDFGFNLMSTGQQDTVRLAISKKQAHVWGNPNGSDYYGFNSTSYGTTSNWATWGYYVLTDLAMAGEPGANATRTITYARANWCFLTYGVYETGNLIEGLGKNEVDMRALVALARNGYSMLGHPNLRAYATKYMPAITQPFGYSFVGTDLLGGFDNVNNYTNPIPSSPAYGGWLPKPGDIAGIKYAFPTDTAVDFVWKNFIKQYTSKQTAKDGYYQYQTFNTVVSAFWSDIFGAIYPSDYFNTSFSSEAQSALKTDAYFDYRGGFASLRSGFDQNAASLWFHNRSDLGGHPYDNKNDIMFSALGRAWLPKISTAANTESAWSSLPTAASGVLINGLGASLGFAGRSVPVIVPGKIVYFSNNTAISEIAGDATTAFSYKWTNGSGNPAVTETRNSFQYSKSSLPYFNVSFYNYPDTWYGGAFDKYVREPYSNGVVKKVYRTVAMVKDAKPIVIIADDIQRNNSINNYKWLCQLATDLTVDSVVVDTTHGYYRNDVILKEPIATGSRRLLVRVLNNTGSVNTAKPARIDTLYHVDPAITPIPANTAISPRLVIESNSIDPKFKVMLYAYNAGETLPTTTWKGVTHDTLVVVNNSTTKTIYFPVDSTGRTNIVLASAPFVGSYTIYNKKSHKPINVIGASLNSGTLLEQNNGNTVSQVWNISDGGGGYSYIVNKNSGLYMDANGSPAGTPMSQLAYINHNNNLWQIKDQGNGYFSLINQHSHNVAGVVGSSVADSAHLELETPTGADNQLFNFYQNFRVGTSSIKDSLPAKNTTDIAVGNSITTIKDTTKIADNTNKLILYPNPTTGAFQVKTNLTLDGDVKLIITNTVGAVMYYQDLGLKRKGDFNCSVNLNGFPKGVYFLKLVTPTESKTDRFFLK